MSSERDAALQRLLAETGWAAAERHPLAGDASTRRYERLALGGKRAILMDAPRSAESGPCPPSATPAQRRDLGWNATSRLAASRVEAFVAVCAHLRSLGLSAPEIYGADLDAGWVVLEDLGDGLYANIIPQGADEEALYAVAAEVLAHVHAAPVPRQVGDGAAEWPILDYDALALEVNADLFVEWLPRAADVRFDESDRTRWERVRDSMIVKALGFPRAFTIRDYHAENLLWLPERDGLARVGLLDFQDALRGWRAWDFVMLLQDARRDVSPAARNAAIQTYLAVTGADEAAFMREYAVLGALNSMRILGLFARLSARDGKDRYLKFMPRMWAHLAEDLRHPALGEAQAFVAEIAGRYLDASVTPLHVKPRAASNAPKTAMVLAAGMGTRMKPLTDTRPKPLIEVGGKALIDHMLDRLADVGVERVVVNVHHFADMMEAHLSARAKRGIGPAIAISNERDVVLETGGGLKKALPLLGDGPVWVANIDSVWIEGDMPALDAVAAAWDPTKMDVCLMLAPTHGASGFHDSGDVFLDDEGVLRFKSEGENAPFVYVGVHICDPNIVADQADAKFSLLPVWRELAKHQRVHGVAPDGYWMHVGDPVALSLAEQRLALEARAKAAQRA